MKLRFIVSSCIVLATMSACSAPQFIKDTGLIKSSSPKSVNGSVGWKLYPDPRNSLTRSGEEIVFALTPSVKGKPFSIFFGDGSVKKIGLEDISCPEGARQCKTIPIPHTYKQGQAYYPYIQYDGSSERVPSDKDSFKIIIARSEMKSDKQVERLAIDNFSSQLVSSLGEYCKLQRDCGRKETKFAIALLTDSNFEQNKSGEKIFTIVKDLSLKMLNNDLNVLEKNPQALVRLAHESVVESVEPNGKRRVYSNNRKLDYLSHLDYSLQTRSGGAGNPIIHSIRVEGTNDEEVIESASEASVTSVNSVGKNSNTRSSLRQKAADGADQIASGNTKRAKGQDNSNSTQKKSKRKEVRPTLLAKFKTANYLLVLHEVEKLSLIQKPGKFYSTVYDTDVSKRQASMLMNVRLLSREGEILWMKDIKAAYTDQLASGRSSQETVIPVAKLYQQEVAIKNQAAVKSVEKLVETPLVNKLSGSLEDIPFVGPVFGFLKK